MPDPVVTVSQGRLRGSPTSHGFRFRGVPYAAPPDSTGRFAPPRRHPAWAGVLETTAYGATALQPTRPGGFVPNQLLAGPNSANLNIASPTLEEAGLPVLFWIHGGAFSGGSNAVPWCDGMTFARDGIVFVSANYRLGVEGFLPLPGAPDNRGLLDLIAALAWVQENIPSFGGDPNRVTIAGQSAGAGACAMLLGAPGAEGLFRGAICMSGSIGFEQPREQGEQAARDLAGCLGIQCTPHGFESVPPDALLQAQEALARRRAAAFRGAGPLARALAGPRLLFAPVVDRESLPRPTIEAVVSGSARHLAVLAGATAQESVPSLRQAPWITEALLEESLSLAGLDRAGRSRCRALYAGLLPGELVGQIITDRTFRLPAQQLLAAHQRSGGTGFGYEFRWAPASGPFAGSAFHCLDLPFAFDTLDTAGAQGELGEAPPRLLAATVHEAFVRFVRDQDPGWPQFDPRERPTEIFDAQSHLEGDPLRSARALWGEVAPHCWN